MKCNCNAQTRSRLAMRNQRRAGWLVAALLSGAATTNTVIADDQLRLPAAQASYNIPSGPLGRALSTYASSAGVILAFDPALTQGKTTDGLQGRYSLSNGFARLLEGTGLEVVADASGRHTLRRAVVATQPAVQGQGYPKKSEKPAITTKDVNVRAERFKQIGPLPGLMLSKEQIAGNIQSITAEQIKQSHSLSLSELMNTHLQSVNVNDYQGNPFQMDVTYRGFTASPQLGTPQGLSVFFDGIRVNEPFGDVVNWDLIPMNALAGMDVFPGSNPLFGLNTLGGALVVRSKSGFTDEGVEADILTGSFGRKQLQASGGWNNGTFGAFGAVNLFLEDGWRVNSPSKVNQAFGKLEWQGDRASLALSSLAVVTKLVGNGTLPVEMGRVDPTANFTSPDETQNRLSQWQLSGIFDVTDSFNITGQVYRRSSNRHSNTGDIIDDEAFSKSSFATRRAAPGETIVCGYVDSNGDKLPDYYVEQADATTGQPLTPWLTAYYAGQNPPDSLLDSGTFNQTLPGDFLALAQYVETQRTLPDFPYDPNTGGIIQYYTGTPAEVQSAYYIDSATGIMNVLVFKKPFNEASCTSSAIHLNGDYSKLYTNNPDGSPNYVLRDGRSGTSAGGYAGYIDGTPTAVITDSKIDQTASGASLQLNWNLDRHKFMVGASMDSSGAKYIGKQRLGLLDADRNVYSDPASLGEEFFAADHDVTINDFDGNSLTKSLYLSETWSPTDTLNFSFSGRYNHTATKNTLAPLQNNGGEITLTKAFLNHFADYAVCTGADPATCNHDLSHPEPNTRIALLPAETEKFTYRSFNPAFGMTWQATPRLNIYGNWGQGTRVPSVIELGCAYDDTPVIVGTDWHTGNPIYKPRSLAINNACTLPTALSGDPFLPQVKARTFEVGSRGKFSSLLEWNISAYRTNLYNDIYMVGVTPELSFFQDVGETRRQGVEFGLNGEYGRSDFRLNYSLTEATFQSNFKMISPNNSSRNVDERSKEYGMVAVNPGDFMPGIPLNNLNASWGYKLTPKWKMRLNMVAHGGSYVRGNENNDHAKGPGRSYVTSQYNPATQIWENVSVKEPDYTTNGRVPGYAVFNLSTSYDLGKGWSVNALVNNLLDKKYSTAGRLGLNPFAPSIHGLIGASGFNYNSSEWLGTQFTSIGAPRGVWVSLNYDFDASKKYDPPPSTISMTEPDRLIPEEAPLTEQELAVQRAISTTRSLPVLKNAAGGKLASGLSGASLSPAEKQVSDAIEAWRSAWQGGDSATYLGSYAESFADLEDANHQAWMQKKQMQFDHDKSPTVQLENLLVAAQGKRVTAIFTQKYASDTRHDVVRKALEFEQVGERWVITRELLLHAPRAQKPSLGRNAGNGLTNVNAMNTASNAEVK